MSPTEVFLQFSISDQNDGASIQNLLHHSSPEGGGEEESLFQQIPYDIIYDRLLFIIFLFIYLCSSHRKTDFVLEVPCRILLYSSRQILQYLR